MAEKRSGSRVAATTYLLTLGASRAFRWSAVGVIVGLAAVAVAEGLGYVEGDDIEDARRKLIVLGVPALAAFVSELSLRDGLSRGTTLYLILGPPSRRTLAVVRSLLTGVGAGMLVAAAAAALGLLTEMSWDELLGGAAAAGLGAFAYVGLFGLIHAVTARGLVWSLAFFATVDYPLGIMPFALARVAPSEHVRALAGLPKGGGLPIPSLVGDATTWVSVVVLVSVGLVGVALTAWWFGRRDLTELA